MMTWTSCPCLGVEMYLTQMKLNPARPGTRRALGSDQVMHAMVLSSFPHLQEGERVLWRVDVAARHDVMLYVASPAKPDMTAVVEQAGWPLEPTWRTASYEPLLERLAAGQKWRFRLTANPTRNVSRGPNVRGKVRPCRTAEQQSDWLMGSADRMGVDFGTSDAPTFQVVGRTTSNFKHRGSAGRIPMTKATFEGRLTVQDPEKLRTILTSGVGRGKAYGCGLLTLAAG